MDARYTAVLEIGSSKVKGAVARTDTDGGATLVAMHEVKTVNCVRHGRVQNVQEVAARVDEVLRRLENDPAVAPRKIRRVRIALGGRSVISVHTSAEAKLPAEVEITAETIERLKRDATFGLPADKQVLAVLPRSYNVDGAEVGNPVGMFGRHIRSEMTVVLAAHDNHTNLERVRMAGSGDNAPAILRSYVPRQLALARMALTPSERQLGCVLVDMGSETTTISIHRGGVLHTLVTLPMGGRNITRDLAAGLSCTEEQAEYIKTAQAAAIPDADDASAEAKEINSYAQARAGEIIANILHRIELAGFKTSELPGGIVLTGGASRMRRMAELFETQTRMKVRLAPADNSVRPGTTGADPVGSLDIMALAAWPVAEFEGSDLSELPETKTAGDTRDTFDDYHSNGYDDYSDEEDDERLLEDDPEDEDDNYRPKKKPRKEEKKKPKTKPVEVYDEELDEEEEEEEGTGRFGWLRRKMQKFGHAVIGTPGPEDMDE